MNTIISKYKRMVGAVALTLAMPASTVMLTGCNDFLDTLPLNDVVLENFWTEKEDVTSVLNSCYESLESPESIMKMAVWGEMRSDNIDRGNSGDFKSKDEQDKIITIVSNYDLSEMFKENLLPTNSLAKWGIMYQTINRCNTVCHYAPIVEEKDPNYTVAEMKSNIAEATFIRDLCYFYLIRTFRDVPITFEPSIDDTKEYQIPPVSMMAALDTLIADLEKVKDDAVRRYVDDSRMTNTEAALSAYENSSRVTRVAIYALLADMNLWRGNWDECIKYCNLVIDFKKEQYRMKKDNLGDLTDMYEYDGIPLIREARTGTTSCGNAYNQIFGTGNSFESLFELYFKERQKVKNDFVNNCYDNGNDAPGHLFVAPDMKYSEVIEGKNDLFAKNDCRFYETMSKESDKYYITKYVNSTVSLDVSNVTNESSLKLTRSKRTDLTPNWIVYRLTDVMLMKAEAEIMKGEEGYQRAFNLINAVNMRARNFTSTDAQGALSFDNYKQSRETMEQLLLDERKRELMFEGKRWYDLVRVSLRDGDTRHLVTEATEKYQSSNKNAIMIKLGDPNTIFFPYHRDELRLNTYLKQNSAYSDSEDFVNN